jgi:hypothetical protein
MYVVPGCAVLPPWPGARRTCPQAGVLPPPYLTVRTLPFARVAHAPLPFTRSLLQEGDITYGVITQQQADVWFINSINTRNNANTSITASGLGSRLDLQPYAYGA